MQDRYFTKHYDFKTFFLLLVLSFEDHFRFLMLFLNKHLNVTRIKVSDLNALIKEKAVKNQSNVSKSYFATLSLVIVVMVSFSVT